jgi:hypothetical protein|tara:strand:- start:15235 stop:17040 length:1806 start_codon:yes stop_codon:yes gene_type:complete
MGKFSATELDFDFIKSNLKDFLRDQAVFQDFDFEGSGMSILLDVLAYNTHYLALQANLTVNESFLDSATLRESIVSLAKHLNYTPTSATAPLAKINIELKPTTQVPTINIDRGTRFTTSINGVSYSFVNIKTYSVLPDLTGKYFIEDVEIVEGKILDFEYVVNSNSPLQRFVIPNKNIDTSTLSVVIQTSSTDTTNNVFLSAKDTTLITGTDRVYFLQESESEKFELTFGNGTVGAPVVDGNIIKINYLVTNGPDANSARQFKQQAQVGGLTSDKVVITTSQVASNGALIQSKEDVQFLAPKLFSTQGRAVTTADYKNILLKERRDIESIVVWGGEDADPKAFGTVNIAIKPFNQTTYSNAIKKDITNSLLKDRNIVSITPVIQDPDFTYVNVTTDVNYDPVVLTSTSAKLQSNIEETIKEYFKTTLNKFDIKLRHSVLSRAIDATNNAIRNNETVLTLEKEANVLEFDTAFTFTLKFNNEIKKGSVTSLGFKHALVADPTEVVFLRDNNGILEAYKVVGSEQVLVDGKIGTVDYTTGKVILKNLKVNELATNEAGNKVTQLIVRVIPVNLDIEALLAQILSLDATRFGSLNVSVKSESVE